MILEAEDGFLFIVSCENTRILYASNSVSHVLNHTKVNTRKCFELYYIIHNYN